MTNESLPQGLVELLRDSGVEVPEPGTENWEFELREDDLPEWIELGLTTTRFQEFSKRLKRYGCRLNQEYTVDDNTRHFDYRVPTPGWPEPLGYHVAGLEAKPDEEPEFQTPKARIKTEKNYFSGPISGGIPKKGDDRHEDIPDEAYGLTHVKVVGPEKRAESHSDSPVIRRCRDVDLPGEKWMALIEYARAGGKSRKEEEFYSSELGEYPRIQIWKTDGYSYRKRIEFFDSKEQTVDFVEEETGAPVSEKWPQLERGENQQ